MIRNTGTKRELQAQFSGSYLDDEASRDRRLMDLRRTKQLQFAYGRLRLVNAVLAFHHWGPCRTDDGPVYFDLMLPYAVEITQINPASDIRQAGSRFRCWMPKYMAEIGEGGFNAMWEDQLELRSIALSHNRVTSRVGHILHLPTAERIRTDLRITQSLRDSINVLYPDRPPIRTVGVIDPPNEDERREADRLRKERARRAAGMTAQSDQTKTRDRAILAAEIGCSARTLSKHDGSAVALMAFLVERGVDFQKVSAQYILGDNTGQIFATADDDESFTDDGMTILQEIASDPYGLNLDPGARMSVDGHCR